jgi:molybdopterin-guanine dinucleotide biosynthesis protein A
MGGQFSGNHKGLQPLAGQSLLSHVIARLQPQCKRLLLSVEAVNSCWEDFGLEQVADLQTGSQGPLGGLLAAIQAMHDDSDWLLLVPCDAPFLPLNLAELLARSAAAAKAPVALISYQQQWQPTFSLWHRRLLPDLRAAVLQHGQRGLKEFLQTQPVAVLEWTTSEPNPFFNINTADDLAAAAALLDRPLVPIS